MLAGKHKDEARQAEELAQAKKNRDGKLRDEKRQVKELQNVHGSAQCQEKQLYMMQDDAQTDQAGR